MHPGFWGPKGFSVWYPKLFLSLSAPFAPHGGCWTPMIKEEGSHAPKSVDSEGAH